MNRSRGPADDSDQQQPAELRVSTRMTDLAAARAAVASPEIVELAGHPDAYAPEDIVAAYNSHQRELFSFALASTRSREAAEDLVQEAFARLIETMAAGTTPGNVRAWLYHVLANLVTSRARRQIVAVRRLPFLASRASAQAAEADFLGHEVDAAIPAALDQLTEVERTALLLAARGLSGRDVAAALGRSEAATRTLMCRARMRLRQHLKTEAGM